MELLLLAQRVEISNCKIRASIQEHNIIVMAIYNSLLKIVKLRKIRPNRFAYYFNLTVTIAGNT